MAGIGEGDLSTKSQVRCCSHAPAALISACGHGAQLHAAAPNGALTGALADFEAGRAARAQEARGALGAILRSQGIAPAGG